MQPIELRVSPAPLELRAAADAPDRLPMITGYAAVFDSPSMDLGGFVEVVKPGAFTQCLKDGHECRALFDHTPSCLLGRMGNGTLRLWEDERGLGFEIDPPNTQTGRDVVESIRRGDIQGASFGFRTVKDRFHLENGRVVRDLIEVIVRDVSPTALPAYPATDVALRSLQSWQADEAAKAEAVWKTDLDARRRQLKHW